VQKPGPSRRRYRIALSSVPHISYPPIQGKQALQDMRRGILAWQPASIKQVLQPSTGTSSHALKVMTDKGTAYLKPFCKEVYPHALIKEWVGLHLAAMAGLVCPDVAIVNWNGSPHLSSYSSATGETRLAVFRGPQLLIRELSVQMITVEMVNEGIFKRLLDPLDADRLIVVDTLLRNYDRQDCFGETGFPQTVWENVLVTPNLKEMRVAGLDFNRCLPGSGPDGNVLSQEMLKFATHEGIYGLVPGLKDRRTTEGVQSCLKTCAQWIDEQYRSQGVVSSVPEEWCLGHECKSVVLTFLKQRAQFLLGDDDGK